MRVQGRARTADMEFVDSYGTAAEQAMKAVAARLVPHYPQLLSESMGSAAEAVASGYGDAWRVVLARGSVFDTDAAASWVDHVVLTNGTVWAATILKLDLNERPNILAATELLTDPLASTPWDRLSLGVRVRHVNHAIRQNTAAAVGLGGLLTAVWAKATWNGQTVRNMLWAQHLDFLLTVQDCPAHVKAEIENERFLFALTCDRPVL